MQSVQALFAACYSAACAPPSAGGTGGSLPGGIAAHRSTAPRPSEMGAKAFANRLRTEGFLVKTVNKVTSRSWDIVTEDGKKIRVSGGGSLAKVPHDGSRATMRQATPEDLERLKIPKHWTDVTVSVDPTGDNGCLARGFHSKTRAPLSLYSAEKTAGQAEKKYTRVKALEEHMDAIDRHVSEHAPTDDTAAALMLIRRTGMRPGSVAETKTFGATTLQARHVEVLPNGNVRLNFLGKASVRQRRTITDPELAAVIASRVQGKGPNDRIFSTSEKEVNSMLDSVAGAEFNVKDLRTHRATVVTLQTISKMKAPSTAKELKAAISTVAKKVSSELGNDPPTALKSYINPTLFDEWRANVKP